MEATGGRRPSTSSTVGAPRWLSEDDVVSLVDLGAAIDAVERALAAQAEGAARAMEKTHVAWEGGGSLHALGGLLEGAGVVGTKTWAHTTGGAVPMLLLWDARSGELQAVIEAFALGQLRTAAVSAVATRWLARPDSVTMAIIGTGKQALPQVAAVAATRPLRRVVVYSPTPAHRTDFAATLADARPGLTVDVAGSVAEAVGDADVITTVTRAREPVIHATDLSPGTHVNALGAIAPGRRELDRDVVERAALVVADSPAAAQNLSVEVDGVELVPLSSVVAGDQRRPDDAGLTIFKSMGTGIADVAVAAEVLARARSDDAGRRFPHPEHRQPRLGGGS